MIFLGLISSPDQASDELFTEYQDVIEQTMNDPAFQDYYDTRKAPESTIGNVDTWEGD